MMKKRFLWVLVALIAIAAIVLVIVLPRGAQEKKADPVLETAGNDESLPLDTGAAKAPSGESGEDTESAPNIDPGTGMELEEDELPILTP